MRIKVVYIDGSSELFKGETYEYSSEHNMFFLIVGKHRVMIPAANVRSLGAGRLNDKGGFRI